MTAEIFGIPLEAPSLDSVFQILNAAHEPVWIVTANAEILLEAHRDPMYASIVRQADVRTVDGSGPAFLLRLFGHPVSRVTGVDLSERILWWAAERRLRVGLVGGGDPSTAKKAADKFRKKFSQLVIAAEHGGSVDKQGNDDATGEEARHRLTLFAPDVLLVAFGHPKQERWIARHMAEFPKLKVVVGVGGTFDFWAERSRRAPKILRTLGLEWLWRLLTEPRRIGRIFQAVIVFPILFFFDRLKK